VWQAILVHNYELVGHNFNYLIFLHLFIYLRFQV
jgi:hypothetical protein